MNFGGRRFYCSCNLLQSAVAQHARVRSLSLSLSLHFNNSNIMAPTAAVDVCNKSCSKRKRVQAATYATRSEEKWSSVWTRQQHPESDLQYLIIEGKLNNIKERNGLSLCPCPQIYQLSPIFQRVAMNYEGSVRLTVYPIIPLFHR